MVRAWTEETTLAEYASELKEDINKHVDDYELFSEGEVTLDDGTPVYEIVFSGTMEGLHLKCKYVIVVQEANIFLMQGFNMTDRFEKDEAVLWTRVLDMMTSDVIRTSLIVSGVALVIVYIGTRRRNPIYVLLSLIPVGFGVVGLLGTYQWFGANLNFLSVGMVPLVIGVGIDDGIHIIHRYLEEGKGSLPDVIRSTGKAIFLTTATTCLAFSSFLFSSHPSMRFLALVPIIGLSLCFFGAIIFLPALLRMIIDRWGLARGRKRG